MAIKSFADARLAMLWHEMGNTVYHVFRGKDGDEDDPLEYEWLQAFTCKDDADEWWSDEFDAALAEDPDAVWIISVRTFDKLDESERAALSEAIDSYERSS